MATPFPANGTDAEKRAWADAQTAPGADKPAPAPSAPAAGSVDSQIAEIYSGAGGYLRKRGEGDTHTDHPRTGR